MAKTSKAAPAQGPQQGDDFPAFAKLVKALEATLKLDGVSQRGLGRKAGMSDGNIRRALTQGSGISNDSWLKLAAASPEGSPLRELLRDYALPSLAPEAHAVHGADTGRTTVSFSAIVLGPNYRTTLAEEDLEGLAQSILREGILQNVLVRPLADGKLELRGGQRRYRAVELLIKRGEATPDFPIPVLIRAMEDDEALALSIVENIQKVDVHPVEEAEGFRQLRDSFGWSTSKIAEALGGKERLRYVQQRLNIVDKLTPATREAFHEGRVNLDQARALWALPQSLQEAMLKEKRLSEFSADDIRRDARNRCISSEEILFDAAEYDGERFSDGKKTYFVDGKLAVKLQEAAIAARLEALRKKWKDVKIVEGGWIDTSGYVKTKDRTKGIALVRIAPIYHGHPLRSLKVQEGYCKPTVESGQAPAKPAAGLSKRTLTEAHHLKTIELQGAVATSPARISMALTVIALLPAEYGGGCETVHIDRRQRRGGGASLASFNTPAEHHLAGLLSAYAESGMIAIARDGQRLNGIYAVPTRRADFFRALKDDWSLEQIFAAAVARDVGSFPGFEPRYGDDALAAAIAEVTCATLQGKWKMTAPYLDPFRKDQLQAVASACIAGSFEISTSTKKSDAAVAILAHPNRREEWLPPELHFGTRGEIAEAVSEMLGVQIEVPAELEEEDDESPLDDEPEDDGDDEFAGTDEEEAA